MEIVVIHEDITAIEVDAIVNPSLLDGEAAGGPSARILSRGGAPLSEALSHHPLRSGEAILTPAGGLRCRYVIHAAVPPQPHRPPALDDLKKAILAAMKCAEDNHLRSLAFPDMGMGTDGARLKAARAIVSVLRGFDSSILERVLLVDGDVEVVKAFEAAIDAMRDW